MLQIENWKNSTNFDVQQQHILCFCLEVDLTDTKPKKRCMKEEQLSRPKPDTLICDHDQHVNIKLEPNINKNQLKF